MRKSFILSILCLLAGILYAQKRETVDKVLAIVYHDEGSTLILQSHLRPDLTDTVPTLKDVVIRELVLQKARQLKIPVPEADAERHMSRVQEQMGMTREGMISFFKERGYTLEEAKKELEKSLLVEMTVEQCVRSKAYVPQSDIEKYHKENPLVFYEIKQAVVPFAGASKAMQRILVDRAIESGEALKEYQWSDTITLQETDIAAEKEFIKKLENGSVAKNQETETGISLIQLVSKKVIPLEERKQEISTLLGRERYKNAVDNFYDTLLKEESPFVRYIKTN